MGADWGSSSEPGLGGGAAFQGLQVGEESASQEGGREAFSGHRPPAAIPSTLGVNSDPGKGNLFPAAPPSDSGQREGGNPGEGEGTRRFPGSSRVMSQLKG